MATREDVVTGPADTALRCVYRAADGAARCDLSPAEIAEVLRTNGGELWVDIDSSVPEQERLLDQLFHFHPLTIEDTLNPQSRVKLEDYGDYLFMIIRGVAFDETTPDPYDLRTLNLCFYLGQHYLVTVHAGPSRSVSTVADQLEKKPELLGRGAERLMHAIMDVAVDAYFPVLDQIEEFAHHVERRVFVHFDSAVLRDVFSMKRVVLALRRHLAPQREIFNILTNRPSTLLSPESQIYFRDIYDHMLRINDSLDTYRELLGSTLDAYLTQVSNRLGLVTKGLTVVATISIPFVVVSGMWGMNFARIPFSGSPHGFWIMLVVQVAMAAALLVLLRWQKWL
ncbi:MAG TPA: magnesium transporter CorA family protein [Gemmatimonadaceae bacterium]|nr:magnesium transporter CorA family protein [Gemmatimonadaceae bacterium]